MAVLVELAKQPSELVTKNALLDAVWPNQDVADGVLTRAVYELRQVLADDASNSRYIETFPRRGYRLICEPQPLVAPHKEKNRPSIMLAAAAAAIATVLSLAFWLTSKTSVVLSPFKTVAVLPFENMTRSVENDYVGDGLAEALIHAIAQQPGLGVTARTSSFALRDSQLSVQEIGQQLGVDRIIEGSVREERGVQRITIQLIDTRTGLHDMSVELDIVDGDLFNAQRRINQTVQSMLANAGAPVVTDAIAQIPATESQVYDMYLKGRVALHNRSVESLQRAYAYFDEAIKLDPQFAPAHAGLAQFYLVSRFYLQMDADRSQTLARSASDNALALDPRNVDALIVAAAVAMDTGDHATSVSMFREAIRLQPSNAQANQWYGEALAMLGYVAAARDNIEIALLLNPLAGSTNSVRAKAAGFFTDDDRHLETGRQGDALGALLAARELALYYFRVGNAAAFGREIARYHAVVGVDATAAAHLVSAMAGSIEKTDLLNALAPLGDPKDNYFSRELAMLGLHHEAMDSMLRGSLSDTQVSSDIWLPEFEGVRALPAFVPFIESLGLDRHWEKHGLPDACQMSTPEPFCRHFVD